MLTTRFSRPAMLMVLIAIVLGGCETFGRKKEAPTDPNAYPTDYKTEVAQFLRTYLNVPTNVRDAYIAEPALKPVAGSVRYVACVRYNAKGTNGRYLGSKDGVAIFYGGAITQFLDATREFCGTAVYQRFPELEALVP